jgi:hypothetical protein
MWAICGNDLMVVGTEDVQFRVGWPGWRRWAGAMQRQDAPADNY